MLTSALNIRIQKKKLRQNTHWIKKRKTYSKQQTLKSSAQLDKSFSKDIFSYTKITGFEKTSFELTGTEILKIKLHSGKIEIPI